MRKNAAEKTDSYKREETINLITKENSPDFNSPKEHIRDANSRTIFHNKKLTCQFLRDYTGLAIFENLQPEDIEDVTERYKAFLGVQFEADTVKKVRIRGRGKDGSPDNEQEQEVFVLPLVEHKTSVDYDVCMQLLRYMAVIWYDYKKQQEGIREGSSSLKGFRYPPIIPIVYFEGRENWTAGMHLADRIDIRKGLEDYIPDFSYKLVKIHEYERDALMEKHNEMSLVMMINRIQSPEDFTELMNTSRDYVDEIYNKSPADIKEVYQDILWSLFQKMNVPADEARDKMARLEDGGMGELFANMEKMDIQAERRNTQLARQELAESRQELAESKQELAESKQQLAESRQELKKASDRFDIFFSHLVSICRNQGMSRDETLKSLKEQYGLEEGEAFSAIQHYYDLQK